MDALVIGGTRFLGRHTVTELLAHDYDVTLLNRGNHENPFEDHDAVSHVAGDRTESGRVEAVAEEHDPNVVIDCVAYFPEEVRVAIEAFSDARYVVVSSGSAYDADEVPKREGETALCGCTDEQATDDSWRTYGPRKAEIDRIVATAPNEGVEAMSVRPPVVYGPDDYTARLDYWIDRASNHDRVIVPGDGDVLRHMVFVGDVASALRIVAEEGEPGRAYNVGDHRLAILAEWIELLADELGTDVEVVPANERELAVADLEPADFPLYLDYPHVLDTHALSTLGWSATPLAETVAATVADHREGDRTGRENGPDRGDEERVLSVLSTVENE